jgi:hypothetical protein
VVDDGEGPYVRGQTTFGPVPSLDALLDLLHTGE